MEIRVLGTGCANCKALYETVKKAITEMELEVTLIKEEDILKIMEYSVLTLPALVVNEKVVAKGKKISVEEVKELLKPYA